MNEFGHLIEGYRRFRGERYAGERARWRELAEGQSPAAVIIACCDSRADPATIFDTNPGEIFVVRNVANLVPPFESGGGRHGVSALLSQQAMITAAGDCPSASSRQRARSPA